MSLIAAVQPLVLTHAGYQAAYGEDDPEELAIMQLNDRAVADQIAEVLEELFDIEYALGRPREEEGPTEELGDVEDLHDLRRIAAAAQGMEPDDYYEGRAPVGAPFMHLINHSDADGYYLPVDFFQPFFVEEIAVGSSVALLRELDALESILAARWPDQVGAALQTAPDDEIDAAGPVGVWARLRRLCRASIDLDLPVQFG